jgi:hypothetical protein
MRTEKEQVHLCFFFLCLCAYGELDSRADPVSSCTHNSSILCGLCSHERVLPISVIPLLSVLVTFASWVAQPGFLQDTAHMGQIFRGLSMIDCTMQVILL